MKLFSFGSKAASKPKTRRVAPVVAPADDYDDGYAADYADDVPHHQSAQHAAPQAWYPDDQRRVPHSAQPPQYAPQAEPQYRGPPEPRYDQGIHHSEPFDALAEPEAGENFLTAYNIQKTYGTRKVVKGVSLSVRRGQSVGLLGPNGAGKTTVFYMITGLVAADEGKITIDGRVVTRMPMYRRARLGIGYLPQEASIFRGLTVEQNIMAVLELVEPNRKKRKEQLDSLLEEFKITRLRKSPSIALSGGERRRCEIARALASRPSFMLLDEPFAGIDPLAVGDIQDLVRHLTQRGIGVLITDHNVRETLSLIDRAYIIYDGQVLTHGNPDEIINNEDVRRVYLGDMFG
jgi:lipopolysaccharide export system ATP-binding protein